MAPMCDLTSFIFYATKDAYNEWSKRRRVFCDKKLFSLKALKAKRHQSFKKALVYAKT